MSRSIFADFDHYRLPLGDDGTPLDAVKAVRNRSSEADVWIDYAESHGGFWLVSGWDEARAIFRDAQTFSSAVPITPPFLNVTGRPLMLVGYDGDQHVQYRRLIHEWFSPQHVATMAEDFRSDADALIDEFIQDGSADLGTQFGWVVPQLLVTRMLGMTRVQASELVPSVYALSHASELGLDTVDEARQHLKAQFAALISAKREHLGDDVLSVLLQYRNGEGEPLTEEELLDYLNTLVDGALENSSQLLTDALWFLAKNPDLRNLLSTDSRLLETSFDEFLRYFSPANGGSRLVTRDTEVAGRKIREGEIVFPYLPVVNRDPRQFSDPDVFIPDRTPNRHFALSSGVHRCLGAHLIRIEFVNAISAFLRRIPHFELEATSTPHWALGGTSGFETVHVTFEPGSRRD